MTIVFSGVRATAVTLCETDTVCNDNLLSETINPDHGISAGISNDPIKVNEQIKFHEFSGIMVKYIPGEFSEEYISPISHIE